MSNKMWHASQERMTLVLSPDDSAFIHLAKDDQLNHVITKYWADAPDFVVLKLETAKLEGNLVYESNPGGNNKYYHLYKGHIPFASIIETKTFPHDSTDFCCGD